jgi:hypothetical protein
LKAEARSAESKSQAQHQHQHHPSDKTQHILNIFSQLEATLPQQVQPEIKQEAIAHLADAFLEHAYGSNNPAASSELKPSGTPVSIKRERSDTSLATQRAAQRKRTENLAAASSPNSLSAQPPAI